MKSQLKSFSSASASPRSARRPYPARAGRVPLVRNRPAHRGEIPARPSESICEEMNDDMSLNMNFIGDMTSSSDIPSSETMISIGDRTSSMDMADGTSNTTDDEEEMGYFSPDEDAISLDCKDSDGVD